MTTLLTLLKFIHLAAIAVWSAGLIVLPFMLQQRAALADGPELDRLHRFTRLVFVGLTSPAAFVAISSGTALIFLQTTFVEWFSLKMVLVGLMTMLHVVAGLVMAHLYEPGGRFGSLSFVALTTGYIVLIVAILWLVLAKPDIDSNSFATKLFSPGGLQMLFDQRRADTRMPMP